MGKTYYAKNNPEKAIDLESSDYLFYRTGYEHLSSEEFKGIENRKPNPNGVTDYLKAIDDAASSGKYDYIFTAQHPEVVKGIIDMGYDVHNESWINGVVKFLQPLPYEFIEERYHQKLYVHLVPSNSYLTKLIENKII